MVMINDNAYADKTIFDIVKRLIVNVINISKPNNLLTKQDILKYNKQYPFTIIIFSMMFYIG